MTEATGPERHSESSEPDLISDPQEVAAAEARNALRQFDVGMEILDQWLHGGAGFRLRFTHLLTLNRIVLEGISKLAGTFRPGLIRISNSEHQPPEPTQVPLLIEDFCDYINEAFRTKSALHVAAYALWRLNWIHPFTDGNGRTARVVSYILLCARLGYRVPGTPTIPEQIAANKRPYYAALEQADKAFAGGVIDVSALEKLLGAHLATQLLNVHDAANNGEEPVEVSAPSSMKNLPVESDVQYQYDDATYRPVYVISPDQILKTARAQSERNWIEKNPALVTAIATLIGAIITAITTWLLTK
ncbi:MAG: Fic family protein [Hyphomicrobiales bacterium]|nr:Fic family protein [Hyphomicrobiales bacterium]MCC2106654.1 Fic family protein [Hyphomicrobiales bacterium]